MQYTRVWPCMTIKWNYIFKIKADIKLCTSSVSVVTLPVFYVSSKSSRCICMVLDIWIPLYFSDDVTFYVCWMVNMHSYHVWGSENPRDGTETEHESL